MTTHPSVPHTCFWNTWVTGAVHSCTPWVVRGTIPLTTEVRWTTLRAWVCKLPETAAVRSKLSSGACFFNRVQVRWTHVCANGRSQKRCRAINTRLEPMRAAHMARSTIVDNHRAGERQDASDVSPMQSMIGCRAQLRDSDKAATKDSKDSHRFGTPES